ncbi:MAG: YraN family protein [Bifidobacteriaceae bacterium]|jgi:putative endonuclease|nr:YraN family protein [Bifidobacteriaceae bacterium]
MQIAYKNNWSVGRFGEQLVAKDCWRRGWRIIDKNWYYGKIGELDLVASDGKLIIFIEVKTRRGINCGYPLEAINARKRQKLRILAKAWLKQNAKQTMPYRIDSFAVLLDGQRSKISHLKAVA